MALTRGISPNEYTGLSETVDSEREFSSRVLSLLRGDKSDKEVILITLRILLLRLRCAVGVVTSV